jgi:transcriptional regulator with XRE-family HTH domain
VSAVNDEERAAVAALGKRIRIARLTRELTQEQLGAAAGLSRSAVSYIEKGHAPPGLLSVWRIADALNVPVGELLSRSGRP